MQVTNVRVSFLREKQPAQYEKAVPAVEFVANLDDGEDYVAVARALMTDATKLVYNGLGYDVPAKVAAALADGDPPKEVSVAIETEETPEEASEAPKEDKPKGRGRPKGSKNTRPKAGTKAAEEAMAKQAADSDIPGDDIPGDEPRVGPDDNPSDHGVSEDEATNTAYTAETFYSYMMEKIQSTPRQLSVPNAKQILAHFRVARAQDLTDEQATEAAGMVDKMIDSGSKD